MKQKRIFEMTDNNTSMELMHELLKQQNKTASDLKAGQGAILERLGSIEHHMAGLHLSTSRHGADIDDLTERLERVEKRLGLNDDSDQ